MISALFCACLNAQKGSRARDLTVCRRLSPRRHRPPRPAPRRGPRDPRRRRRYQHARRCSLAPFRRKFDRCRHRTRRRSRGRHGDDRALVSRKEHTPFFSRSWRLLPCAKGTRCKKVLAHNESLTRFGDLREVAILCLRLDSFRADSATCQFESCGIYALLVYGLVKSALSLPTDTVRWAQDGDRTPSARLSVGRR